MNFAGKGLHWLTAKNHRIFFFFLALAGLLYLPSLDAKFTSDFIFWSNRYDKQGAAGLKTGFGDPSLKYMYHLLMYGCYRLFGTHPLGWYLICLGLHALNATLLQVLLRKILQHLQIARPWLPLTAALFFLLSPYQTEAVVWAAAIHFLFASVMLLTALIALIRFWETGALKALAGLFIPFGIGLFATEAIFVLPLLLCCLTALFVLRSALKIPLGKTILWALLPSFLMVAGFVGLTYLRFGNPVGHYGAAMHLNTDLSYIGVNCFKYFLKFVLWFRYLPFSHAAFLDYLDKDMNGVYVLLALGIVLFLCLLLLKKTGRKGMLLWFLFFSFLAALLPVINLETLFVKDIQSDRYGYLPSLFFYPFAAAAISFLFGGWLRSLVASLYLIASIICLSNAVQKWCFAGEMIENLVRTFPHKASGRVYILNLVDTYGGAYCLRMGFDVKLTRKYGNNLPDITSLAHYTMYAPADSVSVVPKGNNTYEVRAGGWGGWLWGMPLGDSPEYEVTTDGSTRQYTIRFKDLKPEDMILYQAGPEWRVLSR